MNLRNKTTSEFRTVFYSPLGVPNSQVPLDIGTLYREAKIIYSRNRKLKAELQNVD